jgi:hypothetical protein
MAKVLRPKKSHLVFTGFSTFQAALKEVFFMPAGF